METSQKKCAICSGRELKIRIRTYNAILQWLFLPTVTPEHNWSLYVTLFIYSNDYSFILVLCLIFAYASCLNQTSHKTCYLQRNSLFCDTCEGIRKSWMGCMEKMIIWEDKSVSIFNSFIHIQIPFRILGLLICGDALIFATNFSPSKTDFHNFTDECVYLSLPPLKMAF